MADRMMGTLFLELALAPNPWSTKKRLFSSLEDLGLY